MTANLLSSEIGNPEKVYRRAMALKHIQVVKLMALKGLSASTVEREKGLVSFLFEQYRQTPKFKSKL